MEMLRVCVSFIIHDSSIICGHFPLFAAAPTHCFHIFIFLSPQTSWALGAWVFYFLACFLFQLTICIFSEMASEKPTEHYYFWFVRPFAHLMFIVMNSIVRDSHFYNRVQLLWHRWQQHQFKKIKTDTNVFASIWENRLGRYNRRQFTFLSMFHEVTTTKWLCHGYVVSLFLFSCPFSHFGSIACSAFCQ